MPPAQKKQEPIRQNVHVGCPIEDAFRLFTEAFAEWWPLAMYSLTGTEAKHCALEPWVGGRVFERTTSGEEQEWGSVVAWDPPEHLRFTWHPGGHEDGRQTVDVEFAVEAKGTRVTVIHTGWEAPGVAVCSLQRDCTGMWSTILRCCFSAFVSEHMLVAA